MPATTPADLHRLLADLAPQVLGVVARKFRDFAAAEDAVQEALLAASQQWPKDGLPDQPRAWLVRVASRRITDVVRAESARRHREELVVSLVPPEEQIALAPDVEPPERDDALELLFTCCHPALTPASAIALTLRAVGGLTTAEIARAFLVPEATMAQRISRAKATIQASGEGFGTVREQALSERLGSVMRVLYLVFNEGYAASSGPGVVRTDLSNEAIRLTRLLRRLLPDEAEVAGLLALMLLTDARREARTGPSGELVPLDAQDRTKWDRAAISEGIALLSETLPKGAVGPYQLQAAIAALHDEGPSTEATDWPQILAIYGLLRQLDDSPAAALSEVVALAMVRGPQEGLRRLAEVAQDPRIRDSHRVDAVRAHLLERAGERSEAVAAYRRAAERTTSTPERNYLLLHAARLSEEIDEAHVEKPRPAPTRG